MSLERVQMLLEPEQRRILREIAEIQGKSVAQVTRQAIDLGLQALQQEQTTAHMQAALERAEKLRQFMGLLNLDVSKDLRQIREERDADLQSHH
jgi:uncharacterized protein (DUF1778 family)